MKTLGLIGNPVAHSRSPEIFAQFFLRENNSDFQYKLFPLNEISELIPLLEKEPEIVGLNVTIPFKKKVIPLLHSLNPEAAKAGAVNTIKIQRTASNFELYGHNTDVFGFKKSLVESFVSLPEKALILGTGGSSEAVAVALDQLGIQWTRVGRKSTTSNLSYEELDQNTLVSHLLIVNTTPLGMAPLAAEKPPIPYQFLGNRHCCFDLVYNPENTAFLDACSSCGASVKGGLDMLRYQAERAWDIFKGDSSESVD